LFIIPFVMSFSLSGELLSRPTPFYHYDLGLLTRTLEAVQQAARPRGFHVHYALKANVNEPILRLIQAHGLGADCVSGNEVQRALDKPTKKSIGRWRRISGASMQSRRRSWWC
jgi:diaminopimelate decarboxylase